MDEQNGRLLRAPQVFIGNGRYSPPADCRALYVELVGGGGGGGGAAFSSPNGAVGGGGAGGSYAAKYVELRPGQTFTITVGAGGSGGAAGAAGGNGGDTKFVDNFGNVSLKACGGGGGNGMTAGSSLNYAAGGIRLGTSAGGDVQMDGGPGHHGLRFSGTQGFGGAGGNSVYGGGGGEKGSTGAGQAGGKYGGGGGGGVGLTSSAAGGAGAAGLIRIWEFS